MMLLTMTMLFNKGPAVVDNFFCSNLLQSAVRAEVNAVLIKALPLMVMMMMMMMMMMIMMMTMMKMNNQKRNLWVPLERCVVPDCNVGPESGETALSFFAMQCGP